MAGCLHGVFVGDWLFVFPLRGFSLSLFWYGTSTPMTMHGQHDMTSSLDDVTFVDD